MSKVKPAQPAPSSTGKKVGPPAVAAKPFIVAGLKAVPPKVVVAPPSLSSKQKPSTTSSAVAPSRKSSAFGGNALGAKSQSKQQGVAVTVSRWWQEKATGAGGPVLLRMPEEGKWFDLYDTRWTEALLQGGGGQEVAPRLDQRSLSELTAAVEAAYRDEVAAFHKSKSGSSGGGGGGSGMSSSDSKWLHDMIRSGTLSDKIAALALMAQESPPHQLEALDLLIGFATKKEQRTAQLALEALKDLMLHNLLPDRRLVSFRSQPLGHPWLASSSSGTTARPDEGGMGMQTALIMWYEDQLKQRVSRFVDALDQGVRDTLDFFKKQCMETTFELLVGRPEQEARLLAILVNKLGDPTSAISGKSVELLRKVIRTHPAMKGVVVGEVRQLICRPGLALRTTYACVIFLSQVPLQATGDHEVAALLVEVYVSLFENAIEMKDVGNRLLSALLTGINHAFPYLRDTEPLSKHIDALFRIAHGESFSAAVQALTLVSLIALGGDREREDGGGGGGGGKGEGNGPKGKKGDKNGKGVGVGDSAKKGDSSNSDKSSNSVLVDRFYRALYAKLLSDQLPTRSHNTLFLNLLYRSIKRDPAQLRRMAFVKRLAICATQSTAPIAAGLLFLIAEVCRSRPEMAAMLSAEEIEVEASAVDERGTKAGVGAGSGAGDEGEDRELGASAGLLGPFDALKREPSFACAARPALWEASLLRCHYHPSVKAFSSSLLEAPHQINFAGDPITEFSLSAFLNRFSYRNPKKSVSDKIRRPQPAAEEPVNAPAFAEEDASVVRPDKLFFHRFFVEQEHLRKSGRSHNRSRRTGGSKIGRGEGDEDDDGDEDEDEDEELMGGKGRRARRGGLDEEDEEDDEDDAFAGGDDGEAAMDRFADKLAKTMMREFADGADIDEDDDDLDIGEDGSGSDSGSGSGSGSDGGSGGGMGFDEGFDDDDDDDDDSGGAFDADADGSGSDGSGSDDDGDYGGLMAYGDEGEGEEEEEEEAHHGKKRKSREEDSARTKGKSKSRDQGISMVGVKSKGKGMGMGMGKGKKRGGSDFAAYDEEFERVMDERVSALVNKAAAAAPGAALGKNKGADIGRGRGGRDVEGLGGGEKDKKNKRRKG